MATTAPTADTTVDAIPIPSDWLAQDSVSSLEFCPVQHQPNTDFLAVGAWDGSVRIFKVTSSPGAVPSMPPTVTNVEPWHLYNHQGPVLSLAWSFDGLYLFSGGADKTAMMCNLQGKTQNQVAQHNAPISALAATPPTWGRQMLVTGSWDRDDKTLKYWDCSGSTPIATVPVPERVYSMDVTTDYLAVCCADKSICVYHRDKPTDLVLTDSKNPTQPMPTNLNSQTRVVRCFPPPQASNAATAEPGCGVGSIEGRASIQYFKSPAKDDAQRNITYKCHRHDVDPDQARRIVNPADKKKIQQKIYAVNDVAFNMKSTYATAGSDGTIAFWDKDNKQRLKEINAVNINGQRVQGPITSVSFNPAVNLFALAFSYDWSEGWVSNLESKPIVVAFVSLKSADTDPKRK